MQEDASKGAPTFARSAGSRRMSRGTRVALIAVGVLLFLAISGVLARFFSAENVELDHEVTLMQAEARGDAQGMFAQLAASLSRERVVCGDGTR